MRTVLVGVLAVTGFGALGVAQTRAEVFRVTFDYYFADQRGTVKGREQISGLYTRDRERRTSTWSQVTASAARNATGPFEPAQPRPFMEGFAYAANADVLSAEFFRTVPATAIKERSLVWDTRMFEIFGEQEFEHLKPDVPYHFHPKQEVALAGAGTFTNADVQLVLTGRVARAGVDCWVMDYRALFNPVKIDLPGFSMNGRSHYWGQIWVARATKRIELGTLYEDVLADTTQEVASQPVTANAVRIGRMERVREMGGGTK